MFKSLTFLLLIVFMPGLAQADAPPEVAEIIEQRGLRESASPISETPGWQPRKVLVSLPLGMGLDVDDYREQIVAAAGDVELVFNEGLGFQLSEAQMQGVDGLVGVCTAPNLAAADDKLRWVHNFFAGMDSCKGWTEAQREQVLQGDHADHPGEGQGRGARRRSELESLEPVAQD